MGLEIVIVAQQSRKREIQYGEILTQMILNRRPCHGKFKISIQLPYCAGSICNYIFDGLRLIKYDDIKWNLFKPFNIPSDKAVCGQHHICTAEFRIPLLPCIEVNLYVRIEPLYLSLPVEEETRGEDQEMRAMSRRRRLDNPLLYTGQKTYSLQGLAKPHVIGKAGSQPVLIEE